MGKGFKDNINKGIHQEIVNNGHPHMLCLDRPSVTIRRTSWSFQW